MTIIQDPFKDKLKNAFLLAIFISEVTSLFMFTDFTIPFIHITGYGKYVPFFYTYSQYSLLIIIAIGLSLYELTTKSSNLKKAPYLILFLISTFTIFILDSKSSYILYFITVFIVLYQSFQINKKIILLFISSVIIINTLAFTYSSTFHKRITNIYKQLHLAINNNEYAGSTGSRIGMNLIGFQLFLQKPFIGHGTQEHIDLAIKTIEDLNVSKQQKDNLLVFRNPMSPGMQTLHNEYLDHLIQFGLVGFFILLNIFYSLYKSRIPDLQWKSLNSILLINFMLYMFVNYFFVLNQLGTIFLVLISLTITTYYNSVQRNIKE
ncbi:O-antigen ligase family protein [Sulfurimonas sp. C5]|nr:O-antigen ligase family protein [Sulfurimonas sp. C5]